MMPVTQGRDTSAFGLFMQIPQGERVQAEYIWIGGSCEDLRCKTRTLPGPVKSLADLEEWNYDGSSTGQAPGKDSEVWLRPVKYVPDPFRGGQNILVLCECLDPKDMTPIPTNNRSSAKRIFDQVIDEHPWYGLEQEYTLFENDGITPLGWPKGGYPKPQGPYYCSVGAGRAFGRQLVEAHYRCCLYAGLTISGINAEVMPGQWEYQIGPVEGIDAGDQLWISRYILERVAEAFDVSVSFQPKPIKGDWNGAGCHANFSTQKMREEGGYDAIIEGIEKLETKHFEHMEVYGKNNRQRLTGKHETASYDNFSYGVANRGASIRIPRMSFIEKKGYFEDRRPAANMDPYLVTAKIIETVAL